MKLGSSLGLGMIATGLIMLGLFLLPLGYDYLFFWLKENVANGSYWLAVRYMYMISVSLIISGVALEYFSD